MVNRSLLRAIDVSDEDLDAELHSAFGEQNIEDLTDLINQTHEYSVGELLSGRVKRIVGDEVFVDVGFKSEGVVPLKEWNEDEPKPQPGDELEVLLEGIEEEGNLVTLSKRKASRIRNWERVLREHKEGDVVTGNVSRKIKGGLLVDIGVNVFLPSSQVDIRRPGDLQSYIGNPIQCVILKIDEARRNIVVSRRQLLEQERHNQKMNLFDSLEIGQLRTGIVKNITDFGAFIDLGGIDGLLHITDMSWGRIGHPSEMVQNDQRIEVKILSIDREREKISLGLKQKEGNPWENIETKYPVGSKVTGKVVNITHYGAFVKLEEGVEGLVHISEMSWTKRINHPSEVLSENQEVEVMVLAINKTKEEISLGLKQTQPNPWDLVASRYSPGTMVEGIVRNITNYGAFIEIEEGVDGLLHVSDMSWVRKINHPSELLKKGQHIKCQILTIDQDRKRIALGMKQLKDDPWLTDIPSRYQIGQTVSGKVTKLTNFGVFVELEEGLEGLLHISELAEQKVENPDQVVKVGETIECRVLRVDAQDRKIGLSRRSNLSPTKDTAAADTNQSGSGSGSGNGGGRRDKGAAAAATSGDLKGGLGGGSGLLIEANPNHDNTDET